MAQKCLFGEKDVLFVPGWDCTGSSRKRERGGRSNDGGEKRETGYAEWVMTVDT